MLVAGPLQELLIEDQETIARVLGGEPEAFGELVQRHQAHCFRLCRAILGSREEAEDAAQEALVKAYRALPRFDGRSAFRTWLTRIAINQCKDRLRQLRRRRTRSLEAMAEAGAPMPAGLVAPPAPERAPAIPLEALERLSPSERGLLDLLREDDTLSYAELAGRLGLSLDGVKGRLKRARAKLREALGRE